MAEETVRQRRDTTDEVWSLIPTACRDLADPQRDLPRIARDQNLMAQIESAGGMVKGSAGMFCLS